MQILIMVNHGGDQSNNKGNFTKLINVFWPINILMKELIYKIYILL